MAIDCFMKFEGPNLKGESQDDAHKDEIDVLAWSWSMSQSGASHLGGGGGTGRVAVQDLNMTKYVDSSSPGLWAACARLDHFDKVVLTCRKAGGKEPLDYYVLELKEVIVTSVSTGSGGEDRQTENVTLSFKQCKVEYTPQDTQGAGGGAIPFEFDIAKNVVA